MNPVTSRSATDKADVAAWRRIIARSVDTLWQIPAGLLVWVVTALLTGLNWPWLTIVTALAVSFVQVLGETLLVWGFTTTPGKAMLGLQLVELETNDPPAFRIALLRALKVSTWGMAFWLGPFALVAATTALWRLSTGRKTSWERGGECTAIRAKSFSVYRHVAVWLSSLSIVLLACIAPLLILAGQVSMTTELSQHLRRSISGEWLWLDPLTGNSLSLDSKWRLVSDQMSLNSSRYEVVFAFDEGTENQVKLIVGWDEKYNGPLCVMNESSIQNMDFVILKKGIVADGAMHDSCTVEGAGIKANSVVFGQARAVRKHRTSLTYQVAFKYNAAQDTIRGNIEGLADELMIEADSVEVEDGKLNRYFWLNELTGKTAVLPGNWQLDQKTVNEGGAVSYTFIKLSELIAIAEKKDAVVISGLPKPQLYGISSALQEDLEQKIFSDQSWEKEPTSLEPRYTINYKGRKGRAIIRDGKRHLWLLLWINNESATPPGTMEEHELLGRLLPTLE